MTATPARSRRSRSAIPIALAACLLTVAGCGAEIDENSASEERSVEVRRCGEMVTYHDPQRTIAYEAGSADKMFALGLDDQMLGYVMTPTNPDPSTSPYADHYAKKPLLSDALLNKEVVIQEKADMVVAGWNSGFSEKRGITPEILDSLGVQSFMHTETCYNYPGFPEKQRPFEALYTDMERLGQIYGVEDKASEVVADMNKRMDAVRSSVPSDAPRPSVFLYDSGTDQASTVGNQVPADEIIDAAGGTNIFHDLDERYTTVGWESVVAKNPEVIMVMNYRDKPAEQKIQDLKANPALRDVPAIKNDRIYVIDYNECISGPRNVDGAEKFAAWLAENR
ncbi:ABC transporter substrate-binding protein [Rhodococcus sp. NPDC058521]|uniref:ABC transporter substrate-binding protein n=1 Tax=Rhodococcus sp. NPDC058521 TaxID=3346536 RepID=UPI00364F9B8A